MIKHFWALPAFLRVALCSQFSFSVHDDLLAFPQYEVVFSESYISLSEAEIRLAPTALDTAEGGNEDETGAELQQNLRFRGDDDDPDREISDNDIKRKDRFEYMVLNRPSRSNPSSPRPYLCTIPYVAPSTVNHTAASAAEQQQDLIRASDHGWELLKSMQGQCLYYATGYWIYSFCYNDGIKQFHPLPPGRGGPIFPPVEDQSVGSYVLGRFESDSRERKGEEQDDGDRRDELFNGQEEKQGEIARRQDLQLHTRGETNFLVRKLAGGTTCDLTGRDRRVEVQFHCNPHTHDRINMIKETASCVYLMVIHTPRLCNDVAFLPPQVDKPNPIICQEVVSEDDEDAGKPRKAAEAEENLSLQEQGSVHADAQVHGSENPLNKHPIVGGVEIGAQKLVGGSPERIIKPGKIIANQQPPGMIGDPRYEKYIATLAKSDGKYMTSMSESEMKKHGLKGGKAAVDKWIRDMQGIAGNEPWRLDVVDTPNGREFRGIFGSDEAAVRREQEAGQQPGDEQDDEEGSQEVFKNQG